MPPVPTRHAPRRLTIRAVLLLGFGLTLGLWLFSGYYFNSRISELRSQSARVTDRYVRAQGRMSAVRNQVLLASVYVRDALLDPDPESIVAYRMKLDEAFAIANRALNLYEPVLDSAPESGRVKQLHTQIAEFRRTVDDVLGGDSTRWQTDALPLLRDRIMPKREEAVQISEDVQSLNRKAYIDQQSATTSIYRGAQQRIWTQFGLAIGASFIIGFLAIRHVAALERVLRRQQELDARKSDDLQHLSAQLITAQEEERRTIARELHDEVGQALTAIKVELVVAERAGTLHGSQRDQLATVRALTENALHTVRDLSRLLHPVVLDDIGLPAALEAYVREFRKRYALDVEFEQDRMDMRLPRECETAAYRIVQEALTNVARHSGASFCRVSTRRVRDHVEVAVEDNGVGFDPEQRLADRTRPSLGLLGMSERVARIGGSCGVDSAPGHGTRVLVILPIHNETPAQPADTERRSGEVLGLFANA
jgi:signal transduction histidine kinase